MLYTEEMVRANIRNRDGKRVFFLGRGDTLTPGARDFLSRERVEILSGEQAKVRQYRLLNGATLEEKPEQMTHLHGNVLVPKTHPRIAFRGAMDSLEAELVLCQLRCETWRKELGEILALARMLIRFRAFKISCRSAVPASRMKARAAASSADLAAQRHLLSSSTVSPSL